MTTLAPSWANNKGALRPRCSPAPTTRITLSFKRMSISFKRGRPSAHVSAAAGFLLIESYQHFLRRDRELVNPYSDGVVNGVDDGGCRSRKRHFAHPLGTQWAVGMRLFDDDGLDLRQFRRARQPHLGVPGHHRPSLFECISLSGGVAQALDHASFDLSFDPRT